jgi:hypothetical protein
VSTISAVDNVNAEDALREARLAGRTRQFDVRVHATERMAERSASRQDISHALTTAARATPQVHENGERWRLEGGSDEEGEPLNLVVIFRPRALIVTLF